MSQSLTIDDLKMMEQIITICCRRGAFLPNEMKGVGQFYEKLVNFINSYPVTSMETIPEEADNPVETNQT